MFVILRGILFLLDSSIRRKIGLLPSYTQLDAPHMRSRNHVLVCQRSSFGKTKPNPLVEVLCSNMLSNISLRAATVLSQPIISHCYYVRSKILDSGMDHMKNEIRDRPEII